MSIRRAALLVSTAFLFVVAAPVASVQTAAPSFSFCGTFPEWPGCAHTVLN